MMAKISGRILESSGAYCGVNHSPMESSVEGIATARPTLTKTSFIRCGWVRKRIKYSLVTPYCDRFLCLTSSSLLYFHSDLQIDNENEADCKLPLSAITDIAVVDITPEDSQSIAQDLCITIDNNGEFLTTLRLRVAGAHEGTFWAQQIIKARDQYIVAVSKGGIPPPVKWKRHVLNKKIRGKMEGALRRIMRREFSDSDLLSEDQIVVLLRFGNMLASETVNKRVVEAVFDTLNKMPGGSVDTVEASKTLGQVIAMWLGNEVPEEEDGDSFAKYKTENAMLRVWLKIALERELRCPNEQDCPKEAPVSSRSIGLNCDASMMLFRGNNCESIFLSNYVKSVALKTGMIPDILQQTVLEIVQNPEAYDIAPLFIQSASPPSAAGGSPIVGWKCDDLASIETKINQSAQNAFGNVTSCGEMVASNEPAVIGPPTSLEDSAGGKMYVLSTALNDICTSIVQNVAINQDSVPKSLRMVLKIIYEIAMDRSAKEAFSGCPIRGDNATIFTEAPHDAAERLFCTAASGILFLRLLCPALISPLDWGTLRTTSTASDFRSPPLSRQIINHEESLDETKSATSSTTSFFSSLRDFLNIRTEFAFVDDKIQAKTDDDMQYAWVDSLDEFSKPNARALVDIGSASATLIVVAHILSSVPDVLDSLNSELQGAIRAMDDALSSDRESSLMPNKISIPILDFLGKTQEHIMGRTASQSNSLSGYSVKAATNIEDDKIDGLKSAVLDIVHNIPIIKADDMIKLHFLSFRSLVDPNTEKKIRSKSVKTALVNVAKGVQRVANAACVPESQLEDYIAQCYPSVDLSLTASATMFKQVGDEEPALKSSSSLPGDRANHNFMFLTAVLLKRLYKGFAID